MADGELGVVDGLFTRLHPGCPWHIDGNSNGTVPQVPGVPRALCCASEYSLGRLGHIGYLEPWSLSDTDRLRGKGSLDVGIWRYRQKRYTDSQKRSAHESLECKTINL